MLYVTSSDQQHFQIPIQSIIYDQFVELNDDQSVVLPVPFSSHTLNQFSQLVSNKLELTAETYRFI